MHIFGLSRQVVISNPDRVRLQRQETAHCPVEQPSSQDCARYKALVSSLADTMRDYARPVYLEGGLIIPFYHGVFHRKHADVDIGILHQDLPEFHAYMRSKGFRFFSRNRSLKILEESGLDYFSSISLEEIQKSHVKRLFLVKTDTEGRILPFNNDRLQEMDVHVHRVSGDIVHSGGLSFPTSWLGQKQKDIKLEDGGRISLGSLMVFYLYKLGARRPKHLVDKEVISGNELLTGKERLEAINHFERIRRKSLQ